MSIIENMKVVSAENMKVLSADERGDRGRVVRLMRILAGLLVVLGFWGLNERFQDGTLISDSLVYFLYGMISLSLYAAGGQKLLVRLFPLFASPVLPPGVRKMFFKDSDSTADGVSCNLPEETMPAKRSVSQLDQAPLDTMFTGEPTLDELLEMADDAQLQRIEAGEAPGLVLKDLVAQVRKA